MTWIIGHLLAVCIGISLGLIGGGGSILAVPILIYVIGLSPKTAISMSLVVVGVVSLLGTIPHWLQQNVNLKIAIIFTPAAMIGAYLGARLSSLPFITETFQLICFGAVMLVASLLMIRNSSRNQDEQKQIATSQDQNQPPQRHWFAIPLEGLSVGGLTGFVGVGGGFAIIPALVLLGGIPMKEAVGTSLLIIAFKSVTGFLGYLNQVEIDWGLMISFTLAAGGGAFVGAYLTRWIEAKKLQKGFGYFVLVVAVFVLIRR
ncbi:MAG: sulfite exporter TauE/SafE family protein [Leptolyngbyaceae cyanobacterium MO_188.B28]|nr:sulfite exporter TauE/SafE family protein [Leptolyngbyaceae cyanobacterium MO_188.B28]